MDSLDDILDGVKSYCESRISPQAYDLWIKVLQPVSFEDGTITMGVTTNFQKSLIVSKYNTLICDGLESIMGFPVDFVLISDEEKQTGQASTPFIQKESSTVLASPNIIVPPPSPENAPSAMTKRDGEGEYEYTFDTFIVGSSNKFARAASLAVATSPSGSYNPLFIYGPSGLGKTHLLFAIFNEISRNEESKPPEERKKIIYVKGETFTNELITAIQNQNTDQFHSKYRQNDVLLVDDIQFIAGKESTQEEFFHTFESLYQNKKQIVLTSDRPPKEIKTLEARLSSRFESGLLADISEPDFETRLAIINRKAELLGMDLPTDVAEFIANRLKSNIRQLEGTVKKLEAYQSLTHTTPSIAAAQNAIRDILNDNQPVSITIDRIIEEVSRTYGVSVEDIRSKKRSAPISSARQVAMYIIRETLQLSMQSIGEAFDGKDHSTVVYAIQQVELKMKKDQRYRETIEDIIKNIRD